MLTVKLKSEDIKVSKISGTLTTKIIEVDEVSIVTKKELMHYIVWTKSNNGQVRSFNIVDINKIDPKELPLDKIKVYYAVYIENSNGATTEAIKLGALKL